MKTKSEAINIRFSESKLRGIHSKIGEIADLLEKAHAPEVVFGEDIEAMRQEARQKSDRYVCLAHVKTTELQSEIGGCLPAF